MERFYAGTVERNENRGGGESEHEKIKLQDEEVASFSLPHDGKERMGSIGIDFKLYRRAQGGLILVVENWSRRKGGENRRVLETFNSLQELEHEVVYEDSYTVEIPRKLIQRARRNMAAPDIKFYAPPPEPSVGTGQFLNR